MSSHLPTDEALEKEDRIDEIKKIKHSPPIPHLLQAQQAPAPPYAKVVGCPGTGSYPAPLPDSTTHWTTKLGDLWWWWWWWHKMSTVLDKGKSLNYAMCTSADQSTYPCIIIIALDVVLIYYNLATSRENLSSSVSIRYNTNRPAQLQRLASLEISAIKSGGIILSRQRTTKVLIRLRRLICAFVVCIGHKRQYS